MRYRTQIYRVYFNSILLISSLRVHYAWAAAKPTERVPHLKEKLLLNRRSRTGTSDEVNAVFSVHQTQLLGSGHPVGSPRSRRAELNGNEVSKFRLDPLGHFTAYTDLHVCDTHVLRGLVDSQQSRREVG
jgi:hypothetical protein